MFSLKIFCQLLVFSVILINCSSAQDKSVPDLSPKVSEDTNGFESKEGNFSISISHPLFHTRDLTSETFKGESLGTGKQFIWRSENIIYTVMYSPENYSDEDSMAKVFDDMVSGSRKGILRQGSKLVSEKDISYDKYPGKEFHYVSPDGVKFIGRIYLIDKMGYQINGGYSDDKYKEEVLETLNSFRLLNDKNKSKN